MSDDVMDLSDEGVRLAAEAIFNVRRQPLTWGELPGANKEWYRVRAAAALRAVPESDELVRLRARNDQMLAVLWSIKMACERASVDDPVFVLPNLVIHYAEGAMGRDRERAQSLANGRLSPDEAAGGE